MVELLLQDVRVDPSALANWAIIGASQEGHLGIVERLLQDARVDPSALGNRRKTLHGQRQRGIRVFRRLGGGGDFRRRHRCRRGGHCRGTHFLVLLEDTGQGRRSGGGKEWLRGCRGG
jgi:hypothetical protein